MIEYLDVDDKNVYISTYRRKPSWIEVPKGTEVITGDRFDKYSLVFWKPSIGEVWNHNRFAKYVLQDSVSYEEYVDRWTNDPVVWKRPERTKKQNELGEQTMSIAKTTDTKVNKNIIKLNEDYGIGADDLNIILYERKMNKTETSNNYGKEYYAPVGYYGNIESLLKNLVNKRIILEASENTTLEALVSSVDSYISLLYTDVAYLVKGLKKV